MANIFTSLLSELPWFRADEERRRQEDEQARDEAGQVESSMPKPYVPKSRPEWLPS